MDRKAGRPLTGHVRGLEKVELRYAYLKIDYFGQEEGPAKDGKRVKHLTTFDVISIKSDGLFTTDPIPPGKYHVDLFAVRATTPDQSPQQSDFSCGRHEFTVPEKGEMPNVEVMAKPRAPR
jgi:hypothetical protein